MQTPAPAYSRQGLDLKRFSSAFNADRDALEPFRRNRTEIARLVAGRRYGDNAVEEQPIPLLYQYASVVSRSLVPHNPRCLWTTPVRELQPVVDGVQQYVNEEAARQKLGDEAAKCVVDALISMGVMHVSLADPAEAATAGYSVKVGKPCAKRVSMDDMAFDMHARDFRNCDYIAHRFRPVLDAIRDDPTFSRHRKDLKPSEDDPTNADGDERLFRITVGADGGKADTEFQEKVDLWQVYFPRQRKVVIVSDDQATGGFSTSEPLLVKEWLGPDCGPYHFLGMFWLTDLLLPVAPLPQLFPLHVLTNNLYRKLMDQAESQKTTTVHDGSAAADALAIKNARDGDILQVANLDRVKQMSWNGADPNNQAFVMAAQDQFNRLAGNLELLGGSAPQAKTATQEKLLNMNSSRAIQDMSIRTSTWLEGVFDAMGWFYHNHPEEVMRVTKVPRGSPGDAFERVVHPHPRFSGVNPKDALARHFPYDRIERKLDPYSMQFVSPDEAAAQLRAFFNEIVPVLPLFEQQGVRFDANEYVSILAKYSDRPEMARVFVTHEPPSTEAAEGKAQGASHERTLAPNTTRSYERVNRSEATEGGQQEVMRSALLGMNSGGAAASGNQPRGPY